MGVHVLLLMFLIDGCPCFDLTQNQAFNAIAFLYRQVLGVDFDLDIRASRTRKSAHLPVVLSRQQVADIINILSGTPNLFASAHLR